MSGRCRQHPRAGTKEAKESQSPRGERVGLGTRVVYAFWRPLQRSGSFRARPSDPGAPTRSIMILKLSPPQRAKGNFKNTNRVEKLTKYGFHGPSLDILHCRPKILSKFGPTFRACCRPVWGDIAAPSEGQKVFPAKAVCNFCKHRVLALGTSLRAYLGIFIGWNRPTMAPKWVPEGVDSNC